MPDAGRRTRLFQRLGADVGDLVEVVRLSLKAMHTSIGCGQGSPISAFPLRQMQSSTPQALACDSISAAALVGSDLDPCLHGLSDGYHAVDLGLDGQLAP